MTNATEPEKINQQDLQQKVTDTIITQLEKGTVPWQRPWAEKRSAPFTLPKNAVTGSRYQGVNILLLWTSILRNDFSTQEWGSFNQWKSKNHSIRKGEKGTMVVYYDTFEKEVEGETQKIPFLKHYYVFNKSQLEGFVPDEIQIVDAEQPSFNARIAEVDEFVENTGAVIQSHKGGAMYKIKSDKIMMPYAETFFDTTNCTAQEGFYSVLFHELSHWTGAKHRLDRINHKKFGDKEYAGEELVAEFGAAFLCAGFGLSTLEKGNHSAYIQNWLKVLRNDKTILFTAASAASKAVNYLRTLTPEYA